MNRPEMWDDEPTTPEGYVPIGIVVETPLRWRLWWRLRDAWAAMTGWMR